MLSTFLKKRPASTSEEFVSMRKQTVGTLLAELLQEIKRTGTEYVSFFLSQLPGKILFIFLLSKFIRTRRSLITRM